MRKDGRRRNKDGEKKSFNQKKYNQNRNERKYTKKNNKREYKEDDQNIRLNKYLSNSGVCSRREADKYIQAGLVKVNDIIVTELGVKVNQKDIIKFNDSVIKPEKKVYLLLNKPKDYVTTLKDRYAKHTVMELIEGACKQRVYPVGRLDRNTTGLLLFTNDGEMAKKLTHPSGKISKIYHVQLNKAVTKRDMQTLLDGIKLEDGFVKMDEISYTSESDHSTVGVQLHSGKNRIIRRLFESLGYNVRKLDRVYFAGLTKKGLSRGKWRFLTDQEIGFLNMLKTN